ncbi:hypothetical protein DVH24_029656 [Malus domestica]|uniref:Uncharacterized protein n=1 Tax=Malus domestica TaxID=3750 RepID=A0A498HZ97_MALDO|nr:hypothetical protein DVH24_029656 [Malus domestica]
MLQLKRERERPFLVSSVLDLSLDTSGQNLRLAHRRVSYQYHLKHIVYLLVSIESDNIVKKKLRLELDVEIEPGDAEL